MPKLKWVVEFSVDKSWVADGYNPDNLDMFDMLANRLSSAYSHELGARILKRPDQKIVAKLQGYKSVADMKRNNV